MAVKGAIAKEEIIGKLLEVFPDSFKSGKEIRINMLENGSPVQIKVSLTAAKTAISNTPEIKVIDEDSFFITSEEKEDLKEVLSDLGVTF